MTLICERCHSEIESNVDDYASVLVIENHRKEKAHHSFVLCERCYLRFKKQMERI